LIVHIGGGSEVRVINDGQDYRLLKDYDTGKYKYLTFDGKVTYLDARVKRILMAPCREAMKTPGNDLGLILATAMCAGISAASTFYNGREANSGEDRKSFEGFVRQYMRLAQQKGHPEGSWVEWLYKDVRCGLAHNFTIKSGGIKYEISPSYTEVKKYGPEINPLKLLEDFEGGWFKYLNEVRKDSPDRGLGKKFATRFGQFFRD